MLPLWRHSMFNLQFDTEAQNIRGTFTINKAPFTHAFSSPHLAGVYERSVEVNIGQSVRVLNAGKMQMQTLSGLAFGCH